jgi:hypothetical protein
MTVCYRRLEVSSFTNNNFITDINFTLQERNTNRGCTLFGNSISKYKISELCIKWCWCHSHLRSLHESHVGIISGMELKHEYGWSPMTWCHMNFKTCPWFKSYWSWKGAYTADKYRLTVLWAHYSVLTFISHVSQLAVHQSNILLNY